MTTGSITTGVYTFSTKLHYAKAWFGYDGSSVPGQVRQKQWNEYRMCSKKFHGRNPNNIGVGIGDVRDNHSWNKTGGDPETIGFSVLGDGTVPFTFPTSSFNSIWTSKEELALLSKLLNKVKGHSLDIGVALAEVDKLAGTIVGTLKDLSMAVVYLSRGRFDQCARLLGVGPPSRKARRRLQTSEISGRFLEMRYAWEPTIKDAFEAAQAFEAISNGPRSIRFRAGKRVLLQRRYFTNYCIVPQVVEARRSYIFEMFEEMSVTRQLGLANPASILWERLPWSFVLDWFIPIGTYLELIGQIPFMKGRWLRTDSIRWATACTASAAAPWKTLPPFVDCDWETFNLQRSIFSGPPPVPLPSFRLAGAVQGKRVANAVALAHQVFSNTELGKDIGWFTDILFDPSYLDKYRR
ncbi:TPA_asm: maturation protein [ssRNA phage Esthiorhiza.4_3]|jgi:hypothetical protein|uniref:Maturation protein n=2 Tax=Fiersviridae TaxID=2842319 RepID=A0A8S5KYW9_9VIRU|nr:maturation protein [ssRNA phage Esthiorhiza.4_3]QDH90876.1 MAG: hypothetical protein H4RhizoLitter19524_000002 [Leviviridae sp.]DAD50245.1 TPA_asm: maturation protein [ssRNA phage Esthiorhiza.4_3]